MIAAKRALRRGSYGRSHRSNPAAVGAAGVCSSLAKKPPQHPKISPQGTTNPESASQSRKAFGFSLTERKTIAQSNADTKSDPRAPIAPPPISDISNDLPRSERKNGTRFGCVGKAPSFDT